jgi:hypothetical protein
MADLTEEQLRAIYTWIDAIPLSRPKKNMARDFSDGILLAEVIATYFPTLVDLHNYPPANSTKQKLYNFETLNQKVLRKLSYSIPRATIDDIVNCKPGTIESVLNAIQFKMAKYREKKAIQGAKDKEAAPDPQYPTPERPHQYIASPVQAHVKQTHAVMQVDEEILLERKSKFANWRRRLRCWN